LTPRDSDDLFVVRQQSGNTWFRLIPPFGNSFKKCLGGRGIEHQDIVSCRPTCIGKPVSNRKRRRLCHRGKKAKNQQEKGLLPGLHERWQIVFLRTQRPAFCSFGTYIRHPCPSKQAMLRRWLTGRIELNPPHVRSNGSMSFGPSKPNTPTKGLIFDWAFRGPNEWVTSWRGRS